MQLTTPLTLIQLPDEILIKIVSYLLYEDKTNLRLVCQKIKDIAEDIRLNTFWLEKKSNKNKWITLHPENNLDVTLIAMQMSYGLQDEIKYEDINKILAGTLKPNLKELFVARLCLKAQPFAKKNKLKLYKALLELKYASALHMLHLEVYFDEVINDFVDDTEYPLKWVIEQDAYKELVELVEKGACVNRIQKENDPLPLAISLKRDEMISYLLRKGATLVGDFDCFMHALKKGRSDLFPEFWEIQELRDPCGLQTGKWFDEAVAQNNFEIVSFILFEKQFPIAAWEFILTKALDIGENPEKWDLLFIPLIDKNTAPEGDLEMIHAILLSNQLYLTSAKLEEKMLEIKKRGFEEEYSSPRTEKNLKKMRFSDAPKPENEKK